VTNVPGSSDYFLISGVTYSNQAKINLLGVSQTTLDSYGAVHEQTAREMALGIRRISQATYGLVTTGIAGPGGGSQDKPVGTVCVGLSTPQGTQAKRCTFRFENRLANKRIFAMTALDMLRHSLLSDQYV
jgi:nicotinamide-nucleotide amidase